MKQTKEAKILEVLLMAQNMADIKSNTNLIKSLDLFQLFLSHEKIKNVNSLALSFAFSC